MLRARHSYTVSAESARTEDGFRLAIKRFGRPGSQPVVLMHGLAQNLHAWDLPLAGRSFAEFLAERGFDVWCGNLRSHGRPPYVSEDSGKYDWTVDHHAAYDLPAIVDRVIEVTGKRPFWIGHSMGGMVAYMYLQGARLVRREWGLELSADPVLARERNEHRLKGVVALGSPARLEMESGRNAVYGLMAWFGDQNLLPRLARRPGLARRLLRRVDRVPIRAILRLVHEKDGGSPPITRVLRRALRLSAREATWLVTMRDIWYGPNMTREILDSVIAHALDDIAAPVMLQFLDWIDNRTFRADARHVSDKSNAHVYCEHYDRIRCPVLVGGGVNDRLACIGTMERIAYRAIASKDKTFLPIADTGHVDVLYGVNSSPTLYPILGSWMANRV